jgi:hypothetical protein
MGMDYEDHDRPFPWWLLGGFGLSWAEMGVAFAFLLCAFAVFLIRIVGRGLGGR